MATLRMSRLGSWVAVGALVAVAGCGDGDEGGKGEGFLPDFVHVPPTVRPVRPENVVPDAETGLLVAKDEAVLALKEGKKRGDLETDLAAAKIRGQVVGEVPDFGVVQLEVEGGSTSEVRERLEALPSVAGAMANGIAWPVKDLDDPMLRDADAANDWGLRAIGAARAWDRTMGEGVTVAVIDSGVDPDHPDLKDLAGSRSWKTGGDRQTFESFTDAGGNVQQEGAHGTHVAGTIAARGGNGIGTAGVAPQARILSCQVIFRQRTQSGEDLVCFDTDVVAAINEAMARGAPVMNLSLGPNYSLDTQRELDDPARRQQRLDAIQRSAQASREVYDEVLRKAAARGVILVVAAGNNGRPADWAPLPSSRWTIAVGAIDEAGQPSKFWGPYASNYEDGVGDRSVDLCAPGSRIWSCGVGGGYYESQGTSMAAPHVAGAVALLKSISPSATFDEIRDVLVKTAQPVSAGRDIGPRLDVGAAVEEMVKRRDSRQPPPAVRPTPPPRGQPVLPPGVRWQPQPVTIVLILDFGPSRGGWVFDLIRFLIDAFLRFAIPVEGGRFDEYGRVVDFPRRVAMGPPPDLGNRDRYRYAWDRRSGIRSRNMGTLEESVVRETDGVVRAALAEGVGDAAMLIGTWKGRYDYPPGDTRPGVDFEATFSLGPSGALEGRTSEKRPATFASATADVLTGTLTSIEVLPTGEVRFTKTYGPEAGQPTPVRYTGKATGPGKITGQWSIGGLSGPFTLEAVR